MSTLEDTLLDTLHLEFDVACQDLAQAKASQRTKDTLAARARVVACRDRVDALLDRLRAAAGQATGADLAAAGLPGE